MGGQHSKKQTEYWATELNRIRNTEAAKPWELVYRCSLSEWSKHEALRWGFDPFINYTSRLKQRLQPWTTKGRYFQAAIPSPETQDCDLPASCMYATMSIVEKKNNYTVQRISLPKSYFKEKLSFVEVIAYRGDFAVCEVALDYGKIDLYLVDMRQDTAMLLHTEPCVDRPYILECSIAPDTSCMLIKPNAIYSASFGLQSSVDDAIKCVAINFTKRLPCTTILQGGTTNVAFAFDPRFRHSRIAMANILKDGKRFLQLYDLEKKTVVKEAMISHTESHLAQANGIELAQNLTFSPDGSYIACLMRPGFAQDSAPYYFNVVNIYDSESLSCIRVINRPDSRMLAFWSLVPAAIFPMFSVGGAYLAVVGATYDDDLKCDKVESVLVYKVPPSLCLRNICRIKIRTLVKKEHVKHLPLPAAIKRFLLYVPQLL